MLWVWLISVVLRGIDFIAKRQMVLSETLADRPKGITHNIAVLIIYRGSFQVHKEHFDSILEQKYDGNYHIYVVHDGLDVPEDGDPRFLITPHFIA